MKTLEKWDPKDCYNWGVPVCTQFQDPDYLTAQFGTQPVDIQQVLQMFVLSPFDKIWVFINSPHVPAELKDIVMAKIRAAFPAVGDSSIPDDLKSHIVDLQTLMDQKKYWRAEGYLGALGGPLNNRPKFEEYRRQLKIMQDETAVWVNS